MDNERNTTPSGDAGGDHTTGESQGSATPGQDASAAGHPQQNPYGQAGQYGQAPYGQEPYGQAPYGQAPYGQAPYGQAGQYGQAPYGQAPYGQAPYGQYGQAPFAQAPQGAQQPAGAPHIDMATSNVWGAPVAVAPQPRPRKRRARQAIAALAVAGVVAAGLGFAAGRVVSDNSDTTAAASSATPGDSSTDSGSSTDGSTSDGSTSDGSSEYGYGDGSSSDGSQFGYGEMPGSDGSSSDSNGSSGSSSSVEAEATANDATDAQSQGLVIIETTLTDGEAAGTGMVLSSDGLILTNYHVVEDSTSIKVEIASTGDTYTATVVGHDAEADVALLQLKDASGLTVADIDSTDEASVGDDVTAVGNAEGQGYLSASEGTVTATDQEITTSSEYGISAEDLTGLTETDVAVVGGYSGGAMLDSDGEVVGMTTAASSSDTEADSYYIPIADALSVVSVIESGQESGSVQIGASAYLGVSIDSSVSGGAYVAEVEDDTAASKAGITAGSTITKVDGTKVGSYDALAKVMDSLDPGDSVKVVWTDANGKQHSATVTLGSSPIN
ncbi:trypsin-like peptidase domain-containing protein [Nocardioides sp. GY 10127]|uniref:S1C family serine protease n=1 Tax=Nocardioides sp. GY 10127 TaxID=2569762 RepID=UPI0010A872EC|nr:trypsin-like peptidase domain-containing protein [Nocardioides sp. GY 10127]TIC80889.1 PDZ domain-containing protein [Nocardioides sp. GY 10127]